MNDVARQSMTLIAVSHFRGMAYIPPLHLLARHTQIMNVWFLSMYCLLFIEVYCDNYCKMCLCNKEFAFTVIECLLPF